MIKKVQITFMWIATLLLLAHQLVPHHHHHQGVESCKTEMQQNHSHENSCETTAVHSFNDCLCEHNRHLPLADCELELKTIEKQSSIHIAIAIVKTLFVFEQKSDAEIEFVSIDESLIQSHYFETHTLRGPPELV